MRKHYTVALLGTVAGILLSATASASTLTINMVPQQPGKQTGFDAVVAAFEKGNPDIHVKVNNYANADEKIAIRNWLAADPPDIVYWYPGVRMLKFVKPKLFAPVTSIWDKLDLSHKLAPGVTQQLTYDGQQWGVPWAYYMWGMYYRKDIFTKYHLTVPKTWKEFLVDCATLKQHGVTPIALGDQDLWPAAGWFDYLDMRTNGYKAHEKLMQGKISYDAPSVRKVFHEWADLISHGYFTPNATSYRWQEAQNFMFTGKAAMSLIGSFVIPAIPPDMKKNIGFFQFPVINSKAGPGEDAPIDMFAIPAQAKNKVDAIKFLEFIENPEIQGKFAAAIGELPVVANAPLPHNPLLRQQAAILASTPHFAQFYDRDNKSAMSKYGMKEFQRLLYDPRQVNTVIKRMAKKERQVYKTEN
ncbi:ABC transporter substrate-binding protein [Acidiphilium sp.]|uniref:ABC transporter substrate-binding protein n=1 Tax=Acidiphilium sp. TaxID=527 RepID=UPI003D02D206